MPTYPPDWRVFLVCEENLNNIKRHGRYNDENDIIKNINSHITSQHLKDIRCDAITKEVNSIEEFYPGDELRDGMYTKYYFAISSEAGIIGFLATEQTYDDNTNKNGSEYENQYENENKDSESEEEIDLDIYHRNLFTHKSNTGRECYVAKISWTCSFTNSPVVFRGRKVKDIIGAKKTTYTINMGKYITDQVCELMLNDLHQQLPRTKRNDELIHQVILVSTGIDTARIRHRKNGKLTACRFLEEWENYDENNIMQEYNLHHKNSLIFYLYDRYLTNFIGSDDYGFLSSTGSDLATIIDDTITNNSRFENTNYTCPNGMTFNRISGFPEKMGDEYKFKPLNSSATNKKRGRNINNNSNNTNSAAKRTRKGGRHSLCYTITGSRDRRPACGRPSRRRGRN